MAITKAPTGITITRKDNTLTVTWKIGDTSYSSGQHVEYALNTEILGSSEPALEQVFTAVADIKAKDTTAEITFNPSLYYPNTLTILKSITVRIQGKRGKRKWSAWSTKDFTFAVPDIPTLTATLQSLYNVTQFGWSLDTSDSDEKPYASNEWQSMLVKDSNTDDGSKLDWRQTASNDWQSEVVGLTGTKTITEDTQVLAQGSYTRWFRIRSRGLKGPSGWRYIKHVYARPYQAKVLSTSAEMTEAGGFICTAEWEATANEAHPIDQTTVQYTIVTPEENLACPASANWTDANISADTQGTDKAVFGIDTQLGVNTCLFIRVNTIHDTNITYGVATLSAVGELSNPTNVSSTVDTATHKATITATNNSAVEDSFLAVIYRPASDVNNSFIVGIIEHGETSVVVQCPDWGSDTVAFGVYAVVGDWQTITRADEADCYVVTEKMRSPETIWKGGQVPLAPSGVIASATDIVGTVSVRWNWDWAEATGAEISWADHIDAWESTSQPETYAISNMHAAKWNVSDLETGVKWYFRVRLVQERADAKSYSPWSDITADSTVDLSSSPNVPVLVLSDAVITEDGDITASWVYSTTDGTGQAQAQIAEVTIENGQTVYNILAHTETAQHVTMNAEDMGWSAGESHALAVRVISSSGKISDVWSDPVSFIVAEPLLCEITDTSLDTLTIGEGQTAYTVPALTELPFTITAEGAGEGGTTSIVIERLYDYKMDRPDESQYDGFKGETIALATQTGEAEVSFNIAGLIGRFDDGAWYKVKATVQDGLGQTASDYIDFIVAWDHQAIMPEAQVTIDTTELVAVITPIAPTGTETGDTCDIYRLSADKPELIVENAIFGEDYVDPYPAIGKFGGHRVVFKTINGDYITEDNQPAWIDLQEEEGDILQMDKAIIDFGGEQIVLEYNVDFTSSWKKDFRQTNYLDGAIQGDWNADVSREATLSSMLLTLTDEDKIAAMSRLGAYTGICHVRTKSGASFNCDIQVQKTEDHSTYGTWESYSLSITKVDPQELDGMLYDDWYTEEEE